MLKYTKEVWNFKSRRKYEMSQEGRSVKMLKDKERSVKTLEKEKRARSKFGNGRRRKCESCENSIESKADQLNKTIDKQWWSSESNRKFSKGTLTGHTSWTV